MSHFLPKTKRQTDHSSLGSLIDPLYKSSIPFFLSHHFKNRSPPPQQKKNRILNIYESMKFIAEKLSCEQYSKHKYSHNDDLKHQKHFDRYS